MSVHKRSTIRTAAMVLPTIIGLGGHDLLASPVCKSNGAASRRVCFAWGKVSDPVETTDYTVDYNCQGCSDSPAVDLKTGDLGWVVYSEVISTGAVANIGALTTTDADNYGVKIAKGSGAGAANVASMVLTPSGDHYSSVASGSRISGSLSGNLTVQKTTGGSGGAISLTQVRQLASQIALGVGVDGDSS